MAQVEEMRDALKAQFHMRSYSERLVNKLCDLAILGLQAQKNSTPQAPLSGESTGPNAPDTGQVEKPARVEPIAAGQVSPKEQVEGKRATPPPSAPAAPSSLDALAVSDEDLEVARNTINELLSDKEIGFWRARAALHAGLILRLSGRAGYSAEDA